MTDILLRMTMVAGVSLLSSVGHTQTAAPPSVKPPTIQNPRVTAPTTPTAAAPTQKVPLRATGNMVAPMFNEVAFKSAAAADAVVILVFSQPNDSVWAAQAPLLKTVLREPEFSKVTSFEIDASNVDLASRFAVSAPGTILILKGGVERIRSQRMIKADVIRRMLRLHTAL